MVNHSKSMFITTESHRAGETFMLVAPTFSFENRHCWQVIQRDSDCW